MEPLSDPMNDRTITEVQPPPHRTLTHSLLFPRLRKPNWRLLQAHLHNEGKLAKEDVIEMINLAGSVFRKERNLLEIRDPVTVVGDIHGQFYDLVKLLEIANSPENTKYLFLGDYVDRGSFSIEVVMLLFALKINYPQTFFMIRGNHECRQMTAFFNFRAECIHKYDLEVYERFMDSFDTMPFACLINGKFIAIHGGISPELRTIEDINQLRRFHEPPKQGLACDLLWSDPVDSERGAAPEHYKFNNVRGCSYYYNSQAANAFLKRNNLLSIIRAHEAQLDGYKMHRWNGDNEFPVVITLFSAPNYCDVYNNKAAIVQLENNTLNVKQYNYSPHPYILPNFMDVFNWSIPFVIEKVLEIMECMLQPKPGEELDREMMDHMRSLQQSIGQSKGEVIRNKIKFINNMMRMYKTLREDKELVMQLKGMCPDNKIPKGLLLEGREALRNAVEDFRRAKKWDEINEKRPDTTE